MLNRDFHEEDLRFRFPNWLAHPFLGDRRFMTLPTKNLVNEVQFRGIRTLHKPAMKSAICTGDLTPYLEPVANSASAIEVGELIDAKLNYRNTAIYESRVEWVEAGLEKKLHARALTCRADVDEYFEYRIAVIRSIMKNGLLSRRDLKIRPRISVREFSDNKPVEHDIGGAIGPDGEVLMFRTGHHRLHVARKLGIQRIPIEIHFVHWAWIVTCWERFRRAPIPTAITSAVSRSHRAVAADD